MKKRIAAAVLAFCLALALLPGNVWAEDTITGKWGNNFTWTYDPSTTTLTISGTGEMEQYNSDTDPSRLPNNRNITRVVIEEGITTIAEDAFRHYSQLNSVSFPDSLRVIESHAFDGCSSLTKLVLPDSVEYIGSCAFQECSSLTEINIPDRLVILSSSMFEDCTSLETVAISSSSRLALIDS